MVKFNTMVLNNPVSVKIIMSTLISKPVRLSVLLVRTSVNVLALQASELLNLFAMTATVFNMENVLKGRFNVMRTMS